MTRRWFLVCLLSLVALPIRAISQETTSSLTDMNACILCHNSLDDDEMAPPVSTWRRNVHRSAGVSCQDCHGGLPNSMVKENAHNPEAGYIGVPDSTVVPDVCGTCHQQQRENYISSPHGVAGSFSPNCVDCHNDHEIVHPQVTRIAIPDKCNNCHEDSTLEEFIGLVTQALVPISDARREVETLRPTGVSVDFIQAQVDLAENTYSSQVSHVFTFSTIKPQVKFLQMDFDEINKDITAVRDEVDTRRKFGWVIIVLLVFMAGIIWMYGKSLPDEE